MRVWIVFACIVWGLLLSGCTKKNVMNAEFASYTFQRDTNNHVYTVVSPNNQEGVIYQAQEDTTGLANSVIVSMFTMWQDTALEVLVKENISQLKKKLFHFSWGAIKKKNSTCKWIYLSGYQTDFLYDIDEQQRFYVYQYYFQDTNAVYIVSFHSADKKDQKVFAKSLKNILCK